MMKTLVALMGVVAWIGSASAVADGVVWRGNPLEWKADGNALHVKGSVDDMARREDAVRSRRVCVRARVTPGDVHSAGWATIGLAIRDDNENFWHLAFGRSPKDEGGVHIVELCEKRENGWLAQIQDGLPVGDAVQSDGNWKAGVSYDFELTMDQKGIRGCIREASGKVLLDRSYAFPEGKPAVTAGVPAIHSTGRFAGRIDGFSFTAEDPAPVAAKAIPAYACENFARGVTGKRTGFFHVEKIDGRWWAVDPLGRGYIACGCDHITYQGHYSERSKRWRHREANDRLFASKAAWEEKTVSRLLDWGFNQLGAGCDTALKYRGLSHTVFLSMGDSLCWNREDDSHWILPNRGCPCSAFPNVFHPDFPLWCDYVARERCAPNRDDPWLYGYYLDNEFAWWGRGDKATGLFGVVRGLRKDHTAYLALADYVKSRVPGGLEALDRMPEAEAREVKRGFLRLCAERYFSICAAAVRRHDPNHMVLGARFAGVDGADPVVWEEAGRHSDIVTFNSYPWCDFDRNVILERQGRDARRIVDAFAALQEHARCPMQITEWSFPALDTRCPCSFGGGQRVPTQKERVIASELFARTMLSLPFVVGYDYFMWVDEPAEGMNDNFPEDSNYGLLSEEGVPYEGLTGMFTRLQKDVARWRREPVPAERPAPPDRTYAVGRELALHPLDGTGVRYVREGDRYRVETPGGLVLEGAVGGARSFDRVRFRGEEYGPVSVMVCVRMPNGAKGWFFADKVLSAGWDEGAKCLTVESEGRYAGRTFAVRSAFRFAADRFLFEVPAFRNAGNLPVDAYSCYLRIDSPFAFESVAAHPDVPNCWSSESRTGWYAKDGRSVTVTSRSPAVTCFSYRVNVKDKSIHPDAEFEFPGGNDVTAVQVAAGASVDFKGGVWALFRFRKADKPRPVPNRMLRARIDGGVEIIGIVHWGLNTFTDREWGYGDEDPKMLNPSAFDADQIVGAAKAGGIQGLVFVAKHHDGFCLWPTKTTEHNITKSPFRGGKGDYVKEMCEACRRAGVRFGVYCSPWDRNNADYGTPKYVETYHAQIRELLGGAYGEIFEMWFDGANGGDGYYGGARETRKIPGDYYRFDKVFRFVRELQPNVCIFGMGGEFDWPGNEQGLVDSDRRAGDAQIFRMWEADFPLRPGWFYHEKERGRVRHGAFLMKLYLSSVGHGGIMDIGLAPDRRGLLDDEDVTALRNFRTIKDAFFAKEITGDGESFNVVVLCENLDNGAQVDGWEYLADGKAILSGKLIGAKQIRVLENPVTAAKAELRVTADGGRLLPVSVRRYLADPELVKLVLSATSANGETDTAKWMTGREREKR